MHSCALSGSRIYFCMAVCVCFRVTPQSSAFRCVDLECDSKVLCFTSQAPCEPSPRRLGTSVTRGYNRVHI